MRFLVATLVHLAPAQERERIRRSGLKPRRDSLGVYAMAVVPDFMATYGWAREMGRLRGRLVAVQFRIADDDLVKFGHFASPLVEITAAEAVGAVRELDDPRGFQIIVPRPIRASEVAHVRDAPRVGWRFSPEAKERTSWSPNCLCPSCRTRGEAGEAKIRSNIIGARLDSRPGEPPEMRLERLESAFHAAAELGERQAARRIYRQVLAVTDDDDPEIRYAAALLALNCVRSLQATRGFNPSRELADLVGRLRTFPGPEGETLVLKGLVIQAADISRDEELPLEERKALQAILALYPSGPTPEAEEILESVHEWLDDIDEQLSSADMDLSRDDGR